MYRLNGSCKLNGIESEVWLRLVIVPVFFSVINLALLLTHVSSCFRVLFTLFRYFSSGFALLSTPQQGSLLTDQKVPPQIKSSG